MYKYTNEEFKRYILTWSITKDHKIWIDSTIGGYIETMDNGKFFRNASAAIGHRIKTIKELYKNYYKSLEV